MKEKEEREGFLHQKEKKVFPVPDGKKRKKRGKNALPS